MYEITCPSCQHVQSASFARWGAVTRCPECNKPFRLDTDNCVRQYAEVNSGAFSAKKLLEQRQQAEAGGRASEQVREEVGLSGLSQLMGDPQNQDTNAATEALAAASQASAEASGTHGKVTSSSSTTSSTRSRSHHSSRTGRHKHKRKKRDAVVLFAAGGTIVLAIMVASMVLAYLLMPEGVTVNMEPQQDRPVVFAEPMRRGEWVLFNQPYDARAGMGEETRFIDNTVYRPHAPGQVNLMVHHEGEDVLLHGRARIALLDDNKMELGHTFVPLGALSEGRPQPLVVPVPEALQGQVAGVAGGPVQDIIAKYDGGPIDSKNIAIGLTGKGRETMLNVRVKHEYAWTAKQMVFVILAMDRRNRPIARWRVTWDSPVVQGDSVEFSVNTPLEGGQAVRQWYMFGVACNSSADLPAPTGRHGNASRSYGSSYYAGVDGGKTD